MKKTILLFMSALILNSCNIEDDSPALNLELAAVTDIDLPESFEMGNTYDIDVTYVLPSACHNAVGIDVVRGGFSGEERRQIYVVGVGSVDASLVDCDEEEDEQDMLKEGTFKLTIDDNGSYTFYLWQGLNEDGENQYSTVVVPVIGGNQPTN